MLDDFEALGDDTDRDQSDVTAWLLAADAQFFTRSLLDTMRQIHGNAT